MITITCEDLYTFYADMWNNAEQTGGRSRYFRPLSCWLFGCTYKELPEYMKSEYNRGRIILYPLFPGNNTEDMCDKETAISRIKKPPKKEKGFWSSLIRGLGFKEKDDG